MVSWEVACRSSTAAAAVAAAAGTDITPQAAIFVSGCAGQGMEEDG